MTNSHFPAPRASDAAPARRPSRIVARTLFVTLLVTSGSTLAAPGDLATKYLVNDENPSAHIPTPEEREQDPMEFGYFLQDLLARAEGGIKQKSWEKAAKYYEALARAVPDRALSFSRLCLAYGELGRRDAAIGNCEHAVRLGGAQVGDHFTLIRLLLEREQLRPDDVAELDASIAQLRTFAASHAKDEPPASVSAVAPAPATTSAPGTTLAGAAGSAAASPSARKTAPAAASAAPVDDALELRRDIARRQSIVEAERAVAREAARRKALEVSLPIEIELAACKIGIRLADRQRMAACLERLHAMKVDERVILPFAWSQALIEHDRKRAETLLVRARALELPAAALDAMVAEQASAFKLELPRLTLVLGLLGALVVAAFGALWWLRAQGKMREKAPQ